VKQVWDKYCSTGFSYANKLDQQEFAQFAKNIKRLYGQLLPQDKTANILDVGCGAGHFLYYLQQEGYTNYYGIDISSEQVEFCKAYVTEKVELADVFEFLKDKIQRYDSIVANDLIEHIPREYILEFLNLSYQALRLGGVIILKTGNMSAPGALSLRYIDFTHETGFTERSLAQVLRLANFKKVKVLPTPYTKKVAVPYAILHAGVRFLYRIFGAGCPECLTSLIVGIGTRIEE